MTGLPPIAPHYYFSQQHADFKTIQSTIFFFWSLVGNNFTGLEYIHINSMVRFP